MQIFKNNSILNSFSELKIRISKILNVETIFKNMVAKNNNVPAIT